MATKEKKMAESKEVTQEEIKAAMERYPGLPVPLAVSKFMLDEQFDQAELSELHAGLYWGGLHLERVGAIAQKLADAMYHQLKKSITIKLEATDYPESWDHIGLELIEVQEGTREETDRMGLAGWPCCACDSIIQGTDNDASMVMLSKVAKWDYPSWGNFLTGTKGFAVAALCGQCIRGEKKPQYALRKDGETFRRVRLTELEDIS
jgi:hypothetical protein